MSQRIRGGVIPRPARPIGSAAVVYSAHIDQPEVLVGPHCKLTQFHSPPSPRVILRYGFRSHFPEAIAARRFSIIYIDFALGLAATGGLTSGSALPILVFSSFFW